MNSQMLSRPRPAGVGLGCLIALSFLTAPAYAIHFDDPTMWHNFFCIGAEPCAVGDFNGDGKDDVISFVRNTQSGAVQGDVWVGISTGTTFAASKWSDWIAGNGEEVVIGDFNGDGRADVAVFIKNTQPEPARGDVWVALSTGINFRAPQKWHDFMCVGQQVCAAGNFDGQLGDDIIAFVRDTQTLTGRGDVWVALSQGNGFGPRQKWSDFFCIVQEVCAVGDFNWDHKDDVVAFVRDTQTGTGRGDVWVALSNGTSFGAPQKWSDFMCIGQEVCAVGNFNGFFPLVARRDDVVAFVRDTQPEPGRGDVWVALAGTTGFGTPARWSRGFCIGQEVCAVGDFNGDLRDDVVAFLRDTQAGGGRGDVWVALSLP